MTGPDALSTEEQEASFMNHVMRWRLGLQDQIRRVGETATEYRWAVAQVPPGLAPAGSRLEANWTLTEQWRLRNEVHFLLIAIRNALRFSEGLYELRKDAGVAAALAAFRHAHPDADLLRNVHEHVDACIAGEGRQRKRFPQSPLTGTIEVQTNDVVYEVGGINFHINATARSALELTGAVIRAVQQRLYG